MPKRGRRSQKKGETKDETKEYDGLIKTLGPQVCAPVKNFLQWKKDQKENKEKEGQSLMSWATKNDVLTTVEVPNSVGVKTEILKACRLTNDARGVVRGIIGFVFDLFDRDKVPHSPILPKDIYVKRNIVVWVDNLIVQPSTANLRSQAIDNLKDIIRQFVGNNVPADVGHLINNSLEAAKTSVDMKAAVLMHPSLHMNCKMAAFAGYMYRLLRHGLQTGDKAIESGFDAIASRITVAQPNWEQRIQLDASGTDWPYFFTDTRDNHMDADERSKFSTLLGPLIFMRHAVIHFERAVDYWPRRGILLANVENQLYVLFPTYMSEFVHNMVSLNLFKDHWMK